MLAGCKGSVIDTVQTVSRCLRKHPDKDHGTILVSCLIENEDFTGPGGFAQLMHFLSALASIDLSIIDEVMLRRRGGTITKIIMDYIFENYDDNQDFDEIDLL